MIAGPDDGAYGRSCAGAGGDPFHCIAEHTGEGILVVVEDRIRFSNPAMRELLGAGTPGEIEGHRFSALICPENRRHAVSQMREESGGDVCRLVLPGSPARSLAFRYVSGSWMGEPARIYFFTKVIPDYAGDPDRTSILGRIVRHGIANQLLVLRGSLKNIRSLSGNTDLPAIRKIDRAAREIHHQLESARTYQEIGADTPVWHQVDSLLKAVADLAGTEGIHCSVSAGPEKILADPLIPEVFRNLLDNSLRHGKHVANISITSRKTSDNLVITWEDDGQGIPENEKTRIFEKGYGANTGLGLFLCREILAITGISISETGITGHGARFEITIPAGKFTAGNK